MIQYFPTITGSLTVNGDLIVTGTGSMSSSNAVSSSYAFTASSATSASYVLNAVSSSYAFTASSATNATSASKAVSSSYSDTASFSNNFTVLGNLTVFGTQSVQYITSSQLNVANNIINVNVGTPGVRFGGLSVFDSGSTAGATGSLFWDSQNNNWVYQQVTGSTYTGGMLISGPRNTGGLGNESGTTNNAVMKGMGGDHITSSAIFEVSGSVTMGLLSTNSHSITGSISVTGSIGIGIAANTGVGLYLSAPTSGNQSLSVFDYAKTRGITFYPSYTGQANTHLITSDYAGASYYNLALSARTNAADFFISSSGLIGVGNTTPQANIHIGPSFNTVPASTSIAVAGDTSIRFMAGSDGNANYGSYIAGVQYSGVRALQLGSRQGAGDIIGMTITQGNVGIGTTNPAYALEVTGSMSVTSAGSTVLYLKNTAGSGNRSWRFVTNDAVAGDISMQQSTADQGSTYVSRFNVLSKDVSIPFTTWTTFYSTDTYYGGMYFVVIGLNGQSTTDWGASAIFYSAGTTDMQYVAGPFNGTYVQLRKTGNSIQVYQNGTSPNVTMSYRVMRFN